MIANYRVQAELSAIDSTYDGKGIVLGTVDGCVSVLAIADPQKPEMNEYLANLPSRDEQVSFIVVVSTFFSKSILTFLTRIKYCQTLTKTKYY